MRIYRAFDIEWDADDEVVDLPSEVFILDEEEVFSPDDELVEEICNKYGWLVSSCSYEKKEHFIEA